MTAALCIALFFCGHIVRDGWPSWRNFLDKVWPSRPAIVNPTQLARISGALLCGLGALCVGSWAFAAIIFGSILAGFYCDMKHGEAAGVDTPLAVEDAFLSGITSLIPLGVALVFYQAPLHALVVAAGLLKPPIWKLCWFLPQDQWFYPTRAAAGFFGAVIGGAVVLAGIF